MISQRFASSKLLNRSLIRSISSSKPADADMMAASLPAPVNVGSSTPATAREYELRSRMEFVPPFLQANPARVIGKSRPKSRFLPPPLASNDKFYQIFQNNKKWVAQKQKDDPTFFTRLSQNQTPDYMWIGCADSRVDASEITGLSAGNLFVHRNIANMVVSNDLNLLSVLNYAVDVLKVKHILVVGHYGCGGVKASMENNDLGLVEHWLRNIREVRRLHNDELMSISDENARFRRLVELNVREQCLNVLKTPNVQQHLRKHGYPRVHGLVYDVGEGHLKELDLDFQAYIQEYQHIFAVGKQNSVRIPNANSRNVKLTNQNQGTNQEQRESKWTPPSPVRPGDAFHFSMPNSWTSGVKNEHKL